MTIEDDGGFMRRETAWEGGPAWSESHSDYFAELEERREIAQELRLGTQIEPRP